jgi:hypothetical protein
MKELKIKKCKKTVIKNAYSLAFDEQKKRIKYIITVHGIKKVFHKSFPSLARNIAVSSFFL